MPDSNNILKEHYSHWKKFFFTILTVFLNHYISVFSTENVKFRTSPLGKGWTLGYPGSAPIALLLHKGQNELVRISKRAHFLPSAALQKTDQVITVLSKTIRPYIKISNNFSSDISSNHKDNHREQLFTDCTNQK